MSEFRAAHATGDGWQDAAERCLAQLGPGAGTLGFLYVTDLIAEHYAEIAQLFRARTGIDHWVGATGVGVCGNGAEYLDRPAIAVLVGDFEADSFRVFTGVNSANDAAKIALECGGAAPAFAIVHADAQTEGLDKVVQALAKRVDSGFLVGGLVSSRARNLQLADQVAEGGVSGVAFSDNVIIATRLTQGCSPIGPKRAVTGCQRNVLISLDGKPAFDVFLQDIGEKLAGDLNRVGGHIFAGISVAGSGTDDYLARNLVGIDTQSKLIAIGDYLKKGDQLMFCRRDAKTARDDMARMLQSIQQGLYSRPKAGVYYSCLGRGEALFGKGSGELKMIRDVFGDLPLTGFFCNGEISHNRLYGYTGVLTLFI
ncbi:MAG: histidine kinase [Betaproteobacteria bacterium]|nr:histidine kinase [Betaproteobacteria bacterium]